jgi:hypothetical protein
MTTTKILLIDTNTTPFNEASPMYPIGLDYLQGVLKKNGLRDAYILDLTRKGGALTSSELGERKNRSLNLILETLSQNHWDVVGLGLRNIDSTYPVGEGDPRLHYYLPDLLDYVNCVTKGAFRPTYTVLGGTAFSMMPQVFLEGQPDTCYGVTGPGESSFPGLVEELLGGGRPSKMRCNPVPKIGKLQNQKLIEKYLRIPSGESTFGIRTKIGCGQRCSYCPYPVINGDGQVLKDVDDVLDEISMLRNIIKKNGSKQPARLMFADDIFNRPLEHAKAILEGVLQSHAPMDSWHAYLDPMNIDDEFIELIFETNGWCQYSREAGPSKMSLRSFFFNFDMESGSTQMLKRLGKPYEIKDIMAALESFRRVKSRYEKRYDIHSIQFGFHILVGYPGEDKESIKETCDFINETKPSKIAFQLGVRVYPYTRLAKETKGSLWHKESDLIKPVFANMDKSELIDCLGKYLLPRYQMTKQKGNMILVSQ